MKVTKKLLTTFLKDNDNKFPVKLSSKCSLEDYAIKLLEHGTICAEFHENKIIGLVAGYTNNLKDDLAYISIVCVDEQFKCRGIATKLINDFIKICNSKNIKRLHLYTDTSNVRAIKMYNKLGFEKYYTNNEPRKNDIHLFKTII